MKNNNYQYVVGYLDTDCRLKIETFENIYAVADFLRAAKITRENYILIYGEFLYGPKDAEFRIPEAFLQEDQDEFSDSFKENNDAQIFDLENNTNFYKEIEDYDY